MTTVSIPRSIEEVTERLSSIDRLMMAREWEKAALLAAFVRLPGTGTRREKTTSSSFTAKQFSELEINGLRSQDTVRLYVERWLEVHDGVYPEPGAKVEIPDWKWPPTRTGTDGYESEDGAKATVAKVAEKHPEAITAYVAEHPELVVDSPEAHLAVVKEGIKRTKSKDKGKPKDQGMSALEKVLMQLGAIAYAEDSRQLVENLKQRATSDIPWRPKELERLGQLVYEGVTNGQTAIALLTPVTDEGLAEILGQR